MVFRLLNHVSAHGHRWCAFPGSVVDPAIPGNYRFLIRCVALLHTLVSLVLAVVMFWRFPHAPEVDDYKFTEIVPWVQALGISYHVGVDGINASLLLMGAIVAFAAACLAKGFQTRQKEFYLLLLVMSGGILGAFASLDLFFFYFFHELALVPTFLMIGMWGQDQRKNYAAFQITLYLSLGALLTLILIGLITLYFEAPPEGRSFDIVKVTAQFQEKPMPANAQRLIFPLLMFGFGILVSMWPCHTGAPHGYASAPTPTAMLHAGVLEKFGLYGLIRVALPLMPQGALDWTQVLAVLCLGNIIYCGLVTTRQRDLDLLIANSTVAHVGLVLLGIASLGLTGITGAAVLMVAHGFLAALSFGLTGYLSQQTGTLQMDRLGGLLRQVPFIGTVLAMAMLAGCALPGFAAFPGEALVLLGCWKSLPVSTALAARGALLISAVYMLRATRTVLHGPLKDKQTSVMDASGSWRKLPFILLLGGLLTIGCRPTLLTDRIEPSAQLTVTRAAEQQEKPAGQPAQSNRE